MFTIRFTDPDGTVHVIETQAVSESLDGVRVRTGSIEEHLAAYGDVFVMNGSGATVAKFFVPYGESGNMAQRPVS